MRAGGYSNPVAPAMVFVGRPCSRRTQAELGVGVDRPALCSLCLPCFSHLLTATPLLPCMRPFALPALRWPAPLALLRLATRFARLAVPGSGSCGPKLTAGISSCTHLGRPPRGAGRVLALFLPPSLALVWAICMRWSLWLGNRRWVDSLLAADCETLRLPLCGGLQIVDVSMSTLLGSTVRFAPMLLAP